MNSMKLSLVVPCYNEAENVAAFQAAVLRAFEGCGYDYEIVYGFMLDFSSSENLTFKTFRDSLDFIISLYPNHLYFNNEDFQPTRILSSFDKDKIVKIQHACEAFYTYGRAVPWFLSVLKALKINSTAFFTDFSLLKSDFFPFGFVILFLIIKMHPTKN